MPLYQTVAPTEEPVSLADAKDFLRVSGSDFDDQIAAYVQAARQFAEDYTHRQFCTATYALKTAGFAPRIFIPRPPFGTMTSVVYIDLDGNSQTLSSSIYQLVSDTEGAYLCEAYNQYWPTTRWQPEAVTMTYTTGYGVASAVPMGIRQGILILLRDWYDNCGCTSEADMPMAVRSLLGSFKVWDLEWGGPAPVKYSADAYRVYQASLLP